MTYRRDEHDFEPDVNFIPAGPAGPTDDEREAARRRDAAWKRDWGHARRSAGGNDWKTF